MATTELIIPEGKNFTAKLKLFAENLIKIQEKINFKISSRGWCYQLEGYGLINKSQFDKVQRIINECRKRGFLPLNFTAEDKSRVFECVETSPISVKEFLNDYVNILNEASDYYLPSFMEDKAYYIQILVEKIDLKTLFKPITNYYRIPIATAKGWSDINQRAEIISRFKEAEERGQIPVLLYCGDFDCAGLLISKRLKKNLKDLEKATGWDCSNLIIDRFGLNYDFIIENNLTWIDNLITGSGKDLANPKHNDYNKPYVQDYIKQYGIRKVEANAIVVIPDIAKELLSNTLLKYFSEEDFEDYSKLRADKEQEIKNIIKSEEFSQSIKQLKNTLQENGYN
jgi:hypothetical protein